jgi:2-polyprenyl-3-methyl-5-hydroxy-6-metoxy-1,4-benzoquinol methylase
MKNTLVRLFGIRGAFLHGDTMVLDRWRWLQRHLPGIEPGSKRLLDVGCGSGAFTIGLARAGYEALGISWDERNQRVATERAALCGAELATFEVQDVRKLGERTDLVGRFDVVVCCENIEHIVDDKKLMRAMSACLKPGGQLLLTTPNLNYIPLTRDDDGPFEPIEDGRHVRKGYDAAMLEELCRESGLRLDRIEFCSGWLSQKLTGLQRTVSRVHSSVAWLTVLPWRWLPLLEDCANQPQPAYSICLVATRPSTGAN